MVRFPNGNDLENKAGTWFALSLTIKPMNFRNMVAVLAFLCSYSFLRADTEIPKEAFDQVAIISSGFANDMIDIYFHNGSGYTITSALVHVTIPGTKVDWNYSVDNQPKNGG